MCYTISSKHRFASYFQTFLSYLHQQIWLKHATSNPQLRTMLHNVIIHFFLLYDLGVLKSF
jgi:hypothetical protein